MVSKYCPKCGEELEVKHKCPNCKYIGPALVGKNNESLKVVNKMEQEESHQRRLMMLDEDIKIAEDTIMKLEPMKEEYNNEIEFVRKMVRDAMFKLKGIKGIAEKIDDLMVGVPQDLKEDIMAESFPSSERVILEYTRKNWNHRILGYLAGENK